MGKIGEKVKEGKGRKKWQKNIPRNKFLVRALVQPVSLSPYLHVVTYSVARYCIPMIGLWYLVPS